MGGLGKDPRTAAKDKCTTVALGTSLYLSGLVYKTDDIIVCWGYSENYWRWSGLNKDGIVS